MISKQEYCEPTYEELKFSYLCLSLLVHSILRAYLWGIESSLVAKPGYNPELYCEPTYEELKEFDQVFGGVDYGYCEPTYEELKEHFRGVEMKIEKRLRAYLWGIESETVCNIPAYRHRLRAYLWGIERLDTYPGWSIRRKLRAYLWGIESCFHTTTGFPSTELRAYLWGIESRCLTRCVTLFAPLRAYLWGIEILGSILGAGALGDCEPTYEELKSVCIEPDPNTSVDCEPTYEELKFVIGRISAFIVRIASLPMRNWNSISVFPRCSIARIASLPMRNWNFFDITTDW